MLKRILFACVVAGVCSTSAFAQDVLVSFGDQTVAPVLTAEGEVGTTGTGFILVPDGFAFDGFQVDLVSTDTSVATITSGTVLNSTFTTVGQTRFNNAAVDLNSNGQLDPDDPDNPESGDINAIPGIVNDDGSLTFQATSINQRGLGSPGFNTFDQGFDIDASQFQLASFDYSIVGIGSTDFTLVTTDSDVFAGPTGFLTIPEGVSLNPTFGSASLTGTAVPEPSTAGILALGLIGFVARRRRS